jgi:hypothetical protein
VPRRRAPPTPAALVERAQGTIDDRRVGIDGGADCARRIRRIDDVARHAFGAEATDDRPAAPARCRGVGERGIEAGHRVLVRERHACGVPAVAEEVARPWRQPVGREVVRSGRVDRIGDDVGDADRRIRDPVHERRVGAVLEQPPHEVGQQVLVGADRRVDAARVAVRRRAHLRVQRLAHAVQALELERRDAAFLRARRDPCDRVRVVRRVHRIDRVAGIQERCGAREVRDVGVDLAREHRIVGEAEHLRALDLGVPVRALDQPHRDARARLAGQRDDPVDRRPRALLVRLDGEAESVPGGKRGIATQPREDLERELQAVASSASTVKPMPCVRARAASDATTGTSSAKTRSACTNS